MDLHEPILAADEARYQAMFAQDFIALSTLLDDEMLYTHSSENTDTKSEYLESMQAGHVVVNSAKRTDHLFRISGSSVVMVGRVLLDVTINNENRLLDNKKFTTVWVERNSRWTLLVWASTPMRASSIRLT